MNQVGMSRDSWLAANDHGTRLQKLRRHRPSDVQDLLDVCNKSSGMLGAAAARQLEQDSSLPTSKRNAAHTQASQVMPSRP